jgi:fructose-1,6-bisphosphatase/inositol monophosphatase family enzyme
MKDSISPQHFIDALLPVVRQCAQASLIFYAQVTDIGKAADRGLTGDKAQAASTAFTALDSGLQEILLSAVLQHFPQVGVIAEENTPLKKRFAGAHAPYLVILDPIDGTWHFKRGDAPYHITIGLACDGIMLASIVARPSEDKIFTAVRGQGAFVYTGQRRKKRLRIARTAPHNKVFISSKARDYQKLARKYHALDPREHPLGAALVLTQIAEGQLIGYLTRQVEIYDAGPPSLIAEEAGARCLIGPNRRPGYTKRRKFAHFLAAANDEVETKLLAIIRQGRAR